MGAQTLQAMSDRRLAMSITAKQHYRLKTDLEKMREAKLAASEWRVWLHLEMSRGDNDVQKLPEISASIAECEISMVTYYRAIAKLQKIGVLELTGGAQ